MKSTDLTLIELGNFKCCWYRDFAVILNFGRESMQIFMTSYPDWNILYGHYRLYQYFFN